MPGNVTNIFISYGRADARDLAIRMRDDLQAVGYSVWLDLNELPGGANWSQDIEEAIEYCHVMIAVMSPHSYNSQWCRAGGAMLESNGKIKLAPIANTSTKPSIALMRFCIDLSRIVISSLQKVFHGTKRA